MNRTGVIRDPRFLDHRPGSGHPESPDRLFAVYEMLDEPGMAGAVAPIRARPATDREILQVHTPEYLKKIAATQGRERTALTPDTIASEGSHQAARTAVGGMIEAVSAVVSGDLANAFVLTRPPGHHAESGRAMGYCLFNTVALGAAFALRELGLRRVLLADWDVHHGNGTQHIFERSPDVLFFSTHQFPHFPNTGQFTEVGIGPGEGYSINVPIPRGYGDAEFAAIYEALLPRLADQFEPELVLVSAGFDTHRGDPLGGMKMSPDGFAALTRGLMRIARRHCGGRMVLVLEGGYLKTALAASVRSVLLEMSGATNCDLHRAVEGADPKKLHYAVSRCVHVHRRYWKSLGQET